MRDDDVFSASMMFAREPVIAGAAPNNTAAATATPMANPKTYGSRPTPASHGSAGDCHRANDIDGESADRQPQGSRERADHHAFGEELPRQAQACRAQRAPDRHFVPARSRPDQLQVGDIGTGDQQHQADRCQQDHQRRPRISREVALQGSDFQFASFGHARHGRGVRSAPGLLERLDVRAGALPGRIPGAPAPAPGTL